jgi:hypothetical protein
MWYVKCIFCGKECENYILDWRKIINDYPVCIKCFKAYIGEINGLNGKLQQETTESNS